MTSKWETKWVTCCRVGHCGVRCWCEAGPGWRGSSHSATSDRLTAVSCFAIDIRLGLHRHLRTQPRRQEPADHPVEVPDGAVGGRGALARCRALPQPLSGADV